MSRRWSESRVESMLEWMALLSALRLRSSSPLAVRIPSLLIVDLSPFIALAVPTWVRDSVSLEYQQLGPSHRRRQRHHRNITRMNLVPQNGGRICKARSQTGNPYQPGKQFLPRFSRFCSMASPVQRPTVKPFEPPGSDRQSGGVYGT